MENQYINDIQAEHYIDNGCLCMYCTKMRKNIFIRAKNGETHFEKITHQEAINTGVSQKINIINKINTIKKGISNNSKQNNMFGIKYHKL